MAKIVLTWSNDSNIHSHQKIYKSLFVFDPNTLPSGAVTIGRDARVYEDTDVVEGFTYYYAVATVDWNGAEYLSDVLEVEAVEGDGDPHWDNVVALLHFDGDLVDEKYGPFAQTSGSVAFEPGVFDFAAKFANARITSQATAADTLLRGVDFTIEFFVNPVAAGTDETVLTTRPWSSGGDTGNYLVRLTAGRTILFAFLGASNTLGGLIPLSVGVWQHVAICRDANGARIYQDGVMTGEVPALDSPGTNVSPLVLGAYHSVRTDYLRSAIDELRITKGVARYTENFNPPTAPFPNYGV